MALPAAAEDSADRERDRLAGAVDALETSAAEPVDTHAAQYHELHTLLQDALSATDRAGS